MFIERDEKQKVVALGTQSFPVMMPGGYLCHSWRATMVVNCCEDLTLCCCPALDRKLDKLRGGPRHTGSVSAVIDGNPVIIVIE